MNPARTFGSAAAAMRWDHLWIYFVAPPIGMLAAAGAPSADLRRALVLAPSFTTRTTIAASSDADTGSAGRGPAVAGEGRR